MSDPYIPPDPFVPRWWVALRDRDLRPHQRTRYMPVKLDEYGEVTHAYPTWERIGSNPGLGLICGIYWWEGDEILFQIYDRYKRIAGIYGYDYSE